MRGPGRLGGTVPGTPGRSLLRDNNSPSCWTVWPRLRRSKLALCTALGAAVLGLAEGGQAGGDAAAGKVKAGMCRTCHGIDGVGRMPDVPNIGGESELYITNQLNAFRSGVRPHEQMSVIASGLSDEDIADLAAWYSSIRFNVIVPD